ncbi:MAG: S1/P1 Nuclease [Caulobacter sp.]|nr:S1/P1 Nuclease [Caulobacter sp.]
MTFKRLIPSLCALAVGGLVVTQAMAWGNTGHRLIGMLAVESLPAELPAFLQGKEAVRAIGELAREPDRWKGAGKIHDTDRDPAHFLDLGDDGRILGGPLLTDLQPTRADYEKALQAAGTNSWQAGYLQYSIIDGYQQLVKDFGYWRVTAAAEKRSVGHRKRWYKADRLRREQLILRDLGEFAHYVGDGSQPLHATVHYNGWGDYPNPKGYTTDRIHGPFEGAFVAGSVTQTGAREAMRPFEDCGCPIEKRVIGYLTTTQTQVEPLYALWKDGGFKDKDPRGQVFATVRVAAGASELRDLTVLAWRESATTKVGWPAVSVADVEAGKADPWEAMLGAD